jgi:uncharacterized membrane protein YidH (DUF202 family)
MLSILIVAIVGGGFVIRGFVLIKKFGTPEYKDREKELVNKLITSAVIFFTVALVVAAALKMMNAEQ